MRLKLWDSSDPRIAFFISTNNSCGGSAMHFSSFEKHLIEAINDCSGSVKHCGRSAIHHLEKAWKLRDIDLEMSMFRGITAEEEAASSLFYCLKNNRYKNAEKIRFNEHKYKLGIYPFIKAIRQFLGETLNGELSPFDKFSVKHVAKHNRKAIELLLHPKNTELAVTPIPPLNFSIYSNGKMHTFEKSFQNIIEGKNYDTTLKYIKDIANIRNELLYANNKGIPKVEGDITSYLNEQKAKVIIILAIILMIDPWEKENGNSLFVQQAIDSFLLLLQQINKEDIYYAI